MPNVSEQHIINNSQSTTTFLDMAKEFNVSYANYQAIVENAQKVDGKFSEEVQGFVANYAKIVLYLNDIEDEAKASPSAKSYRQLGAFLPFVVKGLPILSDKKATGNNITELDRALVSAVQAYVDIAQRGDLDTIRTLNMLSKSSSDSLIGSLRTKSKMKSYKNYLETLAKGHINTEEYAIAVDKVVAFLKTQLQNNDDTLQNIELLHKKVTFMLFKIDIKKMANGDFKKYEVSKKFKFYMDNMPGFYDHLVCSLVGINITPNANNNIDDTKYCLDVDYYIAFLRALDGFHKEKVEKALSDGVIRASFIDNDYSVKEINIVFKDTEGFFEKLIKNAQEQDGDKTLAYTSLLPPGNYEFGDSIIKVTEHDEINDAYNTGFIEFKKCGSITKFKRFEENKGMYTSILPFGGLDPNKNVLEQVKRYRINSFLKGWAVLQQHGAPFDLEKVKNIKAFVSALDNLKKVGLDTKRGMFDIEYNNEIDIKNKRYIHSINVSKKDKEKCVEYVGFGGYGQSIRLILELAKHGHLDTFAEGIISFVQNKEKTVFSKVGTAQQFEKLVTLACAQSYNTSSPQISENGHSLLTAALYCASNVSHNQFGILSLSHKSRQCIIQSLRSAFANLKETINSLDGTQLLDKNGNSILLNAISFLHRQNDRRRICLVENIDGTFAERGLGANDVVQNSSIAFAIASMLSEEFLIKNKDFLIKGKDKNSNNLLHHLLSHKLEISAIGKETVDKVYDKNNILQFQGENISKMTKFLDMLSNEELKLLGSQKNDDGFTPLGLMFSGIVYSKNNLKNGFLEPVFDKETYEVVDRIQKLTQENRFDVFKQVRGGAERLDKIYGADSNKVDITCYNVESYTYKDLIYFSQVKIPTIPGKIVFDGPEDKIDEIVKWAIKNDDWVPTYIENDAMSQNVKNRTDISKLPCF